MEADRADGRGLFADVDVTAIAALPAVFADTFPDLAAFEVGEKFQVAFLVVLFDFGDTLELAGNSLKALGAGFFGKFAIHFGPFLVFAGSGGGEVFLGITDSAEMLKPKFRMFLFVIGGLLEESSDLLKTFLFRFRSEVRVFIAGLRFAGKGVSQIGFCFRTLQIHFVLSFRFVGLFGNENIISFFDGFCNRRVGTGVFLGKPIPKTPYFHSVQAKDNKIWYNGNIVFWASGEIGIHVRLRILCLTACGFDPRLAHHL